MHLPFGSVSTSVTPSRPRWSRTHSLFVWLSPGEKKMRPNQLFFMWCIWSRFNDFSSLFMWLSPEEKKMEPNQSLHKKWNFPLKISSVNVQETADLITFTEELLNGKLHFLCSELLLIWCIRSRLIWVSVKILTLLFRSLQNWSARFCFKGSLMLPKLAFSHWKFRV